MYSLVRRYRSPKATEVADTKRMRTIASLSIGSGAVCLYAA
jgi:hypothetical protein